MLSLYICITEVQKLSMDSVNKVRNDNTMNAKKNYGNLSCRLLHSSIKFSDKGESQSRVDETTLQRIILSCTVTSGINPKGS